MTRSDRLVSLVRTLVPVFVGLAVAAFAKIDTQVDSGALTVLIDGAIVGAYYWLVRKLEARWPALGVLLGIPRQPTYTGPADAS